MICPHDNLPMYLDAQAVIDGGWKAGDLNAPKWWRCPSLNTKHDVWERPEVNVVVRAPAGHRLCWICSQPFQLPPDVPGQRRCGPCHTRKRRTHKEKMHATRQTD